VVKRNMICRCDSNDSCQRHITFLVFVRCRPFGESSETPKPVWLSFIDGEKNELRGMRQDSSVFLRPQTAPASRPILRRLADLSTIRCSARAMPELRQGEARRTSLVGRLSVLHQTLRLFRRASLPGCYHSGCCQGTASGPEDRLRTGKTIHARAVAQGGRGRRTRTPDYH